MNAGLAWHALRRAIAFADYALSALAVGWVVVPVQQARGRIAGHPQPRDLLAQRAISAASRGFLGRAERHGLIRIRWSGLERLQGPPRLIVANHPSLIDTPVLASQMPQVDLVVSPSWSRSLPFRRAAALADYIQADRGRDVVREAVSRLSAGRWVAIYPEGSRTPPEGLRPFQRGAAHVALRAGVDLLPVVIRVTPRTLMKGQSWAHRPARTPEWRVEVGEPIRPDDHLEGSESRPVAARRLTAILQEHFQKTWSREDGAHG